MNQSFDAETRKEIAVGVVVAMLTVIATRCGDWLADRLFGSTDSQPSDKE